MSKKPNILLIITDQQTAGAMSCVGNPNLHTPAMDSIAQGGVVFELAYCAQPLCVPSRTSMMTGRMPHEMGVSINMSPQPGLVQVPMLGALLSEAGYDCRYVGKWHLPVPRENREDHGFSFVQDCKDQECAELSSRLLAGQLRAPFFLVSSFRNPHDTCQWARGEELPQGPIGEPPAPDDCPPLPENFSPPADEPEAIREIQPNQPRLYPSIHWARIGGASTAGPTTAWWRR